jgi:hypothetical protein
MWGYVNGRNKHPFIFAIFCPKVMSAFPCFLSLNMNYAYNLLFLTCLLNNVFTILFYYLKGKPEYSHDSSSWRVQDQTFRHNHLQANTSPFQVFGFLCESRLYMSLIFTSYYLKNFMSPTNALKNLLNQTCE